MTDVAEGSFLSGTAAKAEEMLGTIEQQSLTTSIAPVETPAPTPESSPVETTTQTQVADPPSFTTIDPTVQDVRVKIKVNGEEKLVDPKEYSEIIQRTDVWTQRLQAVAQQRKELEEHYARREAEILQAAQAVQLAREEMGRQVNPYAQLLQQMQQQPQPQNPNEVATLGEMQQYLAQMSQQFQQQLDAQTQQSQQQLQQELHNERVRLQQEQNRAYFSSALSQIMSGDDGKLLLELSPDAEAQIRFRTAKMDPKTPQEAVEFAGRIVADWASNVKGRFAQQHTQSKVSEAKKVMEAPGTAASAPAPAPINKQPALKRDGSVDWAALRARAESFLE